MDTKKTALTASGITCSGCAGAVRTAVGRLPGVKNVEVDVARKQVTVTHGPETPKETLAEALTRAGFPASLKE